MADHSEEMGSRRGGWRASLTSFSPSVDSVTHPRTGTQTKRMSTCAAVISNKRMIMTMVKTPPTLLGLFSHGQTAKPLGSESPDLDQVIQSLYLHIEKAQRYDTSFTTNQFSIWSSSLTHEAKWSMKKNEWERSDSDVHACAFIYVYMSERERGSGRWVLMYMWAGRTIARLHFY